MWREKYEPRGRTAAVLAVILLIPSLGANTARPPRLEIWGFHAPWDPRSATSVAHHGEQLAAVVSGWMTLDSLSGAPVLRYTDTVTVPRRTRRFALVTTYSGSTFHPELVRHLGTDRALLGQSAGAIARLATDGRYQGLVLDLEGQTAADTAALAAALHAIVDSAHRRGVTPVAIAVAPADTLAYTRQAVQSADLLVVMLYDQHWATSDPGPIVSPQWLAPLLSIWVNRFGAARIVAGLPIYGYAWNRGPRATAVSYQDVVQFGRRTGLPLTRDTTSAMLHVARPDSVDIWVSDAPLLATLVAIVKHSDVHRIALWRLGLEDPAIWGPAGIVSTR